MLQYKLWLTREGVHENEAILQTSDKHIFDPCSARRSRHVLQRIRCSFAADSGERSRPKFHANALNTGIGIGSGATGSLAWLYPTNGDVSSCAAIGSDGTVYIGSDDDNVYAINGSTGVKKWAFSTGGYVDGSPAIGSNGTIYVGSEDGNVYAINASTGAKVWSFTTGNSIYSSPTIGSDGTVYIGSDDGYLYALNGATGAKKWSFLTGLAVYASPAITSGGTVYVGSGDGNLYAVNSSNGTQLWAFSTGGTINSSPAIGSDGTVYFGADLDTGPSFGTLYALVGTTGAVKWSFPTTDYIDSTPAVGSNGFVYFGCNDVNLYALNAQTGAEEWAFPTGDEVYSSPSIGADGTVYVGSLDGNLYAVNGTTGAQNWSFTTDSYVDSSPAIAVNGTVIVGSNDGNVYAIDQASTFSLYTLTTTIVGSAGTYGIIDLVGRAGPSGDVFALKSSSADLQVPATATIPAGRAGISFPITSSWVSSTENIVVTATFGTTFQEALVTVNPAPITSFYASPSSITGGATRYGVIQLGGHAGPKGDVVTLTSSAPDVVVPATVTVPAGTDGITFVITSSWVSAPENISLTATLGPVTKQAPLALNIAPISSFYALSPTLAGGTSTYGVVDLGGHAGVTGDLVLLQSASKDVQVPASATVPADKDGITFGITTSWVSFSEPVTLTASLGNFDDSEHVDPKSCSDFNLLFVTGKRRRRVWHVRRYTVGRTCWGERRRDYAFQRFQQSCRPCHRNCCGGHGRH